MEALEREWPSAFTVPSHEINTNWYWVEPFLRMVGDPPWDIPDVKRALIRKEAQLWALADEFPTGIIITQLGKCGDTPTGLVWIAAGNALAHGAEVYRNHIEPWFIEKGCRTIEIVGRKGWKAVFPDYEETAVVLVKRIYHEPISRNANIHHY